MELTHACLTILAGMHIPFNCFKSKQVIHIEYCQCYKGNNTKDNWYLKHATVKTFKAFYLATTPITVLGDAPASHVSLLK